MPDSIHVHEEPLPEDVDRHMKFFAALDPKHKPKGLERLSPTSYKYDFVDGHQVRTMHEVDSVFLTAAENLWRPTGDRISKEAVSRYLAYVNSRSVFDVPDWVCEELKDAQLFRCLNPHGDFTLENVLIEDGTGIVIFIDPGHPRGMACRENDEAKLMQSLTLKWDLMNRSSGSTAFLRAPFFETQLHYAFLFCHVVRLLNHPERHNRQLLRTASEALIALNEFCGG